ncbi:MULTISPECIES: TrkH family potassium uptake protein [Marinomonas]|uniref:Trk system potassium uptake protein n=1 Tax=Marinomonas arctica TaxID=383750 RepID=A0A7H1JA31_9GAMM|nr:MULTISPECIES: TrkH family potassium uptake protein [Marinomonas]MCS7486203.1 potassium transporter [Marinomonas sp. BSi20414]QNT07347.1 potassium transporter [Marinomonas arctica]GGN27300.1 Trk system potassium uptake protein [Marinomonas arctica]
MIRPLLIVRLLTMPCIWMSVVQFVFGELSFMYFKDGVGRAFVTPAIATFIISLILLVGFKNIPLPSVNTREAMLFASLTWLCVGILGAIPIITIAQVSFTDGVFESISALTTTGATILSGLDDMPPTFLMYRQFLQWMGGLGVVIFVVAILPMLNIGGMRLLKAETPGPIKDDKLSPRMSSTTHYLWMVYLAITVLCALSYYVAGMSAFDAIGHSFTTVSTGGFSTHDASMGYFNSPLILWICNLFMVLGAVNFALHYRVYIARSIKLYWKDEETHGFLWIIAVVALLLALFLFQTKSEEGFWMSITQSFFHVISFITSTGYAATDFGSWPAVTSIVLIFVGYIGGCAGSTAGGNKVIRNIISVKSIGLEIKRLVHPSGVFAMKFQGRTISESVRHSIMGFMCLAAIVTVVFTLLLMATGMSFMASLSATAACLNVLGPGFAELGSNFAPLSDAGTWLMSFAMILGRLEYFTVLVLFFPVMWRH